MKKFIISSKILRTALRKLGQAVSKNPTIPALSNLYCRIKKDQVEIITSDLELTIIVTCPCEASAEFEVLIPFEFTSRVVALSGDQLLTFEITGTKGRIVGANDSYELGSLVKVKEYPDLPELPKQKSFSVDSAFIGWLKKAQMTCGNDEKNRPAMTMVCFDISAGKLVMATTDGTVIFTHAFVVDAKDEDQLLISAKIIKALDGFEKANILWRKSHIAFVTDGITIIATRHESKFPNYAPVFPKKTANLVIERSPLMEALQRTCLNSDELKTTTIYLKKQEGSIHLEAFDETLNRKILVDIPGSYTGDLEKISVHAEKLLVMMEQVDFYSLGLAIHDVKKAIVITSDEGVDYKGLITPLNINE